MVCMPRQRVTADLPEEVRRGLLIAAAEQDLSIGELIAAMARKLYPDHIRRAVDLIARTETATSPKKPRRPPSA